MVIAATQPAVLGPAGAQKGFGSIPNSLAVMVDAVNRDVLSPRITVQTCDGINPNDAGDVCKYVDAAGNTATTSPLADLLPSTDTVMKVVYTNITQRLQVFWKNQLRLNVLLPTPIQTFLGTDFVKFGFTAATDTGSQAFIISRTQIRTGPQNPKIFVFPTRMILEATGPRGAVASWVAFANDTADGDLTSRITCTTASGSTFPIQDNFVTCSVTDLVVPDGNKATSPTISITVQDTTPPTVVVVPTATIWEATNRNGSLVTYNSSASDIVDGTNVFLDCVCVESCPVKTGCRSGCPTARLVPSDWKTQQFPVGVTSVACSATDSRGNSQATPSFSITVIDTTPPALTVTGYPVVNLKAESPWGNVITWKMSAVDLVDDDVSSSIVCRPQGPGTTFAVGKTTIICTVQDTLNNTISSPAFTITVLEYGSASSLSATALAAISFIGAVVFGVFYRCKQLNKPKQTGPLYVDRSKPSNADGDEEEEEGDGGQDDAEAPAAKSAH